MKTILIVILTGIISIPFAYSQRLDSTRYVRLDTTWFADAFYYNPSGKVDSIVSRQYPKFSEYHSKGKREFAYNTQQQLISSTSSYLLAHNSKYDTSSVRYFQYDNEGNQIEAAYYSKSVNGWTMPHEILTTYASDGNPDTLTEFYYDQNDSIQWNWAKRTVYRYDQSQLIAIIRGNSYTYPHFLNSDVDSIEYVNEQVARVKTYYVSNDIVDSFYSVYDQYVYDTDCPDKPLRINHDITSSHGSWVDSLFYYRNDCLVDSISIIQRYQNDSTGATLRDTSYILFYYSTPSVDVHAPSIGLQMQVYPNPASSFVVLSGYIPEHETGAKAEFYDLQGRLVKSEILNTGLVNRSMPVKGFAEGVYAYRVYSTAATISTGKVFITR